MHGSSNAFSRWKRNCLRAALLAAALMILLAPFPAVGAKPGPRTFRIEAHQFGYTPSEIRVNPGDTITLELVSADVVHGIYVDDYNLSVESEPGQTGRLTFIADKPGSFRLRCSVTCGALHPFMLGRLRVGRTEWLYRSMGLAILIAAAAPLAGKRG
jgi:heme/copper-type cytochrome/quinol oxidase subunit 2